MESRVSRRAYLLTAVGVAAAAAGAAGTHAELNNIQDGDATATAKEDFLHSDIRWNTGQEVDFTADDGTVFTKDYYHENDTYENANSDSYALTNNDFLHDEQRYAGDDDVFDYFIPMENGTYDVLFTFCETYYGDPNDGGGGDGSRVFDISVQGTEEISNLDVHAEVGHDAELRKAVEDVSVTDEQLDITTTSDSARALISAIEIVPAPHRELDYNTVDTTASGDATFDIPNLNVDAAGEDLSSAKDQYGAIYTTKSGDFTAHATLHEQEEVHSQSKAGFYIANDITNAGGSAGDVCLFATGEYGYNMHHDSDGDGYVDNNPDDGTVSYPSRLKMTKSGNDFTGEFSTDGGSNWTTISTVTLEEANDTQDVGLAVSSADGTSKSLCKFSSFYFT